MAEKFNVVINIHGGNNQILPNATEAVQNFHFHTDGRECMSDTTNPVQEERTASDTTQNQLDVDLPSIPYINKEYVKAYAERFRHCATASEVGAAVADMVKEAGLFEETAKKEMFIEKLVPLLDSVTKGKSVDNIRKHIRVALDRQNVRTR